MPGPDMTLGGDPEVVSAAARRLAGMTERFTAGGETVRGTGGRLGGAWGGQAGPAAVDTVTRAGAAVDVGAGACRAAAPALEAYATALRAAQRDYAAARAALDAANDALLTRAADPEPMRPAEEGGLTQARTRAQDAMQAAVTAEQQANRAAATALDRVTDGLATMTAPPVAPADLARTLQASPGTGPAVRPPAPGPVPGPDTVVDHAGPALDVLGVLPGTGTAVSAGEAIGHASRGEWLAAGVAAAGMIPFVGPVARALRGADHLADAVGAGRRADVPTSGTAAPGRAPDRPSDTPATGRNETAGDPVDMGTGHLVSAAVDVEIPGVLPLVLGRTHHSHWRHGRWFGPTWSSWLDEYVMVLDDRTVLHVRDDAHVSGFPHPDDGPVAAQDGTRRTVHREGDEFVVTDLDTRRTRHFRADGWLVAEVDPSGNRLDVLRTADGTPTAVVRSGGTRVDVLVADDRVTGYDLATDDGPRTLVRFGYTAGNLTAVVDSTGLPLRQGYDEHGRLTGWCDRIGTWFSHAYDADDRVVRQDGSGGALSARYAHDDDARTITRTDALGHVWVYAHDDHHRVVAVTDPHGATRRTTHDAAGRPVRRVDELGHVTTCAYDDRGAVVRVERADGAVTTIERDDRGLPVRVSGPDGARRFGWDAAGRLASSAGPDGARTTYLHDDRGALTAVTDALGGTVAVVCDTAGLPVAATDPLGARTTWERDALGRVVVETDPLGARTRWEWTTEGRLAAVTDPLGGVERRLYDGEGNLVALTDPAGGVRRFEYTHFDLLAVETDPTGARTEYVWDAELRLVEVVAATGATWHYERDGCGRVVAETDFDGRRTTVERDAAGREVAVVDALGQRTELRYDPQGHVAEREVAGEVTRIVRDPAGRPVRASTPEVDVVLTRDAAGRVVSETVNGRVLASSYDVLGRRVRRVTPSGQESRWTHDAASRVRSLLAGVTVGFDHDAVGRETRRVAGAAALESRHDPAGRLVGQSAGGLSRRFSYRADGHLTGIDTATGGRGFDLDAAGRVGAVVGRGDERGWSERYRYDPLGNTVDAAWPGAGEAGGARTLVGTRLTHAGGVTYEHDPLGRVIRRTRRRLSRRPETWHYRWNAGDRLVGVTTPDGTRWRYLHDAFGRRVSKQRLDGAGGVGEQVDFTWDGSTLVEQVQWSGAGVAATTWDHDESGLRPVCQRERVRRAGRAEIDERFFAIVTDLVGAPTELLDTSGAVVGRARRSLWGRTVWTGPVSTPLLFPGQYDDPETGLVQNLHRHYDPDTARYASPDPLGLAPAPNPVAYVHNPHTWVDPLGLNGCGLRPGEPAGGFPYERFVEGTDARGDKYPIDTASPDFHRRVDDSLERYAGPIEQRGNLPTKPFANSQPHGRGSELLPAQKDRDYYREIRLEPSAPSAGAGSERLIVGKNGEVWYTPDHYSTARRIR